MENLWGLSLPACQGNPACHQRGTKTSFEAGETELAKSALGFWQEHRLPLQQRRKGKVTSDHPVAQGVWVADKGIHFFIGTWTAEERPLVGQWGGGQCVAEERGREVKEADNLIKGYWRNIFPDACFRISAGDLPWTFGSASLEYPPTGPVWTPPQSPRCIFPTSRASFSSKRNHKLKL